jgi:hypothetical protein
MVPFAGLLAALEQIPDPRRRQGQRYSLAPLLLFAVLAVLAGATSYRRIRLFIDVHRERLNATFGARFRRAPAVNTLRALLHALDPAAIEAAFRRHAEHLADAATPPGRRRVIALDGKTLRGSFDHMEDQAATQVLSAFASEAALILAHQEIAEGDEIAAAQALIEQLGLSGILFTADALHCQKNLRRHAGDRQRAAGAGEGQPASPA